MVRIDANLRRTRKQKHGIIKKSVCYSATGTDLSGIVEDLYEESGNDDIRSRHFAVPLFDSLYLPEYPEQERGGE